MSVSDLAFFGFWQINGDLTRQAQLRLGRLTITLVWWKRGRP